MGLNKRCFVSADWSQLETWLTAHYSGDKVMQGELDAQLLGAHKIHSINAALIYDIDPADAKTYPVDLAGQKKFAYDGGKRLCHAFNYGMGVDKLAKTFWLKKSRAVEILGLLSDKYIGVVEWRQKLADEVFGLSEYGCPNGCGFSQIRVAGKCPNCSTKRWPIQLRWTKQLQPAMRMLYTPFGRRRIYLGRRGEGANAVASQLPQSSGASLWYRTLLRLFGWDMYAKARWPKPESSGHVWSPQHAAYGSLYIPVETFVATGTYDSFLMETNTTEAEEVLEWMLFTMEQRWPELGGKRFPAEGGIGFNWGKYDEKKNHEGLNEVGGRTPFTSNNPYM